MVKAVLGHPRVKNESEILGTYQDRSPYFRPLIDKIFEPHDYPTIALRYLEDDLLRASMHRTLNRRELKRTSRCVLEALQVLHMRVEPTAQSSREKYSFSGMIG